MTLCMRISIGERSYLLPIKSVKKVLGVHELQIESHDKHGLKGSVIDSQKVLTVIDLRHLLSEKSTRFYLSSRIIVLEDSIKVSERFGYIVEKVLDLVRVDDDLSKFSLNTPTIYDNSPCYLLDPHEFSALSGGVAR